MYYTPTCIYMHFAKYTLYITSYSQSYTRVPYTLHSSSTPRPASPSAPTGPKPDSRPWPRRLYTQHSNSTPRPASPSAPTGPKPDSRPWPLRWPPPGRTLDRLGREQHYTHITCIGMSV